MKHPITTACTLSCDGCQRQFFYNHSNVFASFTEARAKASVYGWSNAEKRIYALSATVMRAEDKGRQTAYRPE